MEWLYLLTVLLAIAAVNYCFIILRMRTGIKKLINVNFHKDTKHPYITVCIAARNEEDSIINCLSQFDQQDYPSGMFEVIVVNDQSTDSTRELILDYSKGCDYPLILLDNQGKGGKKDSLALAIKNAKGTIILTTDADCIVPSTWISEMNRVFASTGAVFVSGPVMMNPGNSFFSRFQALEFNALLASTAGAAGLNRHIMSNGANMGFIPEALESYEDLVEEYRASGDDVFLMLNVKSKLGNKKVAFALTDRAIVRTAPLPTLQSFINQRIRWVSKSGGYSDTDVIYVALSVYLFNFLMFIVPFVALGQLLFADNNLGKVAYLSSIFIIGYFAKTVCDYLLLKRYSVIIGQAGLLRYLPMAELFVIIYTTLTGILGRFVKFRWKGRTYQS